MQKKVLSIDTDIELHRVLSFYSNCTMFFSPKTFLNLPLAGVAWKCYKFNAATQLPFSVFQVVPRLTSSLYSVKTIFSFARVNFFFARSKKVENRDQKHAASADLSFSKRDCITKWHVCDSEDLTDYAKKQHIEMFTSDNRSANFVRLIWMGTIFFTFTQNGKS